MDWKVTVLTSVADPNPDLPDPQVFGTPGSGSGFICQRYGSGSGSGSGSFYHQAKKNLDFYCFVTYFLLFIFENDIRTVHIPSRSKKKKTF
jgi:hypothetical protein